MPIELVANHQLKILTSKKLIPDTMYAKLQSKNIEHQQQRQDVVIVLAVEPESYAGLNSIFASPEKDARWAHIDDKSLSFNEKWNSLANCFMNTDDFAPENKWADKDSRIKNVDPCLPPSIPWSVKNYANIFDH
jgi:hypothetical protein